MKRDGCVHARLDFDLRSKQGIAQYDDHEHRAHAEPMRGEHRPDRNRDCAYEPQQHPAHQGGRWNQHLEPAGFAATLTRLGSRAVGTVEVMDDRSGMQCLW